MRIARVLLPARSYFDLKCFRFDREGSLAAADAAWNLVNATGTDLEPLSEQSVLHELRCFAPDLLHVYGSGAVPHSLIRAAATAWLADRPLETTRPILGRRARPQSKSLLATVAEPGADEYFSTPEPADTPARPKIGALRQSSLTASICALVNARIQRFRDDVEWALYDTPPAPAEMASLNLWVDLSDDERELDGLVCEALVVGVPVVATRPSANRRRTADGRAPALCPKRDPNEIAHAIVTMLFKPERSAAILAAATELRERFRPANRRETLLDAYSEIVR